MSKAGLPTCTGPGMKNDGCRMVGVIRTEKGKALCSVCWLSEERRLNPELKRVQS